MKIVCLRISSTFGSFNRPFSNSGGLFSFPFPTKTSIIGIIGAIFGFDLKNTLNIFQEIKVGIKTLSPLKQGIITYNAHYGLRANRERKGSLSNIRQQLLYQPEFEIYIALPDLSDHHLEMIGARFPELERDDLPLKVLQQEQSYYPLFMGKSQHLLTYKFVERQFTMVEDLKKSYFCSSVIPADTIGDFSAATVSDLGPLFSHNETYKLNYLFGFPLLETEKRNFSEFTTVAYPDFGSNLTITLKPQDKYLYLLDKNEELFVLF